MADYDFKTIKGEDDEHQALFISWPQVARFLGRDFGHTEKDERALIEALDLAGAPAIQYAELEYGTDTDENGFYILGPIQPREYQPAA